MCIEGGFYKYSCNSDWKNVSKLHFAKDKT